MAAFHSIIWKNNAVHMLDQRLLPQKEVCRTYTTCQDVSMAIKEMVIRGAPAIGIAAAYGLALAAKNSQADNVYSLRADLATAADCLRAARPTAINLAWAIERVLARAANPGLTTPAAIFEAVLAEAHATYQEDVQTNRQIGLNALPLVPNPAKILHHCNTGSLATADYGTALGIIRTAHEHGKNVHAFLDETRPRLQGSRLSAWELQQLDIPHTVIVDGASGHLMRTVGIDLCVVGCDHVAANGDVANKIGTYNLALAAHVHGVPFYVAAPTSTINLSTPTGDDINIEARSSREVTHIGAVRVVPVGTPVKNPAFDVTPAKYITAIITEKGIVNPPFEKNLAALMAASSQN